MNNEDQFATTPSGGNTPPEPTPPVNMEPIPDNQPIIDPMSPTNANIPPQTDPIEFSPEPIIVGEKKKSKVGLIIAAIVGVLVIAGGVFGVLWFINFTKPENVVLSATTKVLDSKAAIAEGNVTVSLKGDNDFGITSITLDLSAKSSFLPSALSGVLTFSAGSNEIALDLGSVSMTDGSMYFQLDGVTELLETALPEELVPILAYFESELDEFDGQWYELDLVEIANVFGAEVDSDDYDCTIAALNSLNSDTARTAFVEGYKENTFIVAGDKMDTKKNDGAGYKVTVDSELFSNFLTHLRSDTSILDFPAPCSITDEDFEDAIALVEDTDFPTFVFYISDWSHELKAIDIFYENDTIILSTNLSVSFPDSITVSTPEDSKPFSGFLEDFMEKITQILSGEESASDEDSGSGTGTNTGGDTSGTGSTDTSDPDEPVSSN